MTRPVLPVTPGELAEMVARLWPAAAREHGVDPETWECAATGARGRLFCRPLIAHMSPRSLEPFDGALESLACALEDAGLEAT